MGRLGQPECGVAGIDITVAGEVQARDDAGRIQQGPQSLDLREIDHVRLYAAVVRHISGVGKLVRALGSACQAEGSRGGESDIDTAEGTERRVELTPVGGKLRQGVRAPRTGDQAGGMPGRPARQGLALAHDDIGDALASKVVGDARTDDATAHDDDLGLRRGIIRCLRGEARGRQAPIGKAVHEISLPCRGRASTPTSARACARGRRRAQTAGSRGRAGR